MKGINFLFRKMFSEKGDVISWNLTTKNKIHWAKNKHSGEAIIAIDGINSFKIGYDWF